MSCTWLGVRGHLYDTPDFERVMVWTVYEMTIWAGLGISLPFLGCHYLSFSLCLSQRETAYPSFFFARHVLGDPDDFVPGRCCREWVCLQRQRETALHRRGLRYSASEMNKEKTYEPPDENFSTMGAEHFRCTEVLLLPDFICAVCTLSLPSQRGRLLGMSKRSCATFVWISTHGSSRLRKLTRRRPACSQTNISSLSRRTFPFRGSVVRRTQCPSTEVTLCITPSFVGLAEISQSVS